MQDTILILDFGSQYTQLIARRVRELEVFSEILPYSQIPSNLNRFKGIILSGSPFSVSDSHAPYLNLDALPSGIPVLGICYGAQFIAQAFGGRVEKSDKREYGKALLSLESEDNLLFRDIDSKGQVWMSHGDTILTLPEGFMRLAHTRDVSIAAFASKENHHRFPIYCLQFHPEVTHTGQGARILENFVRRIAGCVGTWTPTAFVEETIRQLKSQIGQERVVLGLSGGVDSTVAALLIHRAIGKQLTCLFIDNGLLRKEEFTNVLEGYQNLGLRVLGIDAREKFLNGLQGIADPESKRKIIGKAFIDVFEGEARKLEAEGGIISFLGQGTIYPDVIESVSVQGPSVTIKSHHNVGGLPEKLSLKLVEPLRTLFKDEVRKVGKELGLPETLLKRHPFPGPGLAIRILGEVTSEKVRLLQEADAIFVQGLKEEGLYDQVWQAAVILLPIHAVGVMGDERTYEQVVALRAVSSTDGMTAEWSHLPHAFLGRMSTEIINKVKGINRVVYDISTKPPATIEWE